MRWLAWLLLIPFATANGLTWVAPDEISAQSPLQAAYMIVAQEEPLRLTGHVDVWMQIFLDDRLLFDSSSLHEHDGFHGLTFTPPGPGTLRLVATPAGGEAVEHRIQVTPNPRADSDTQAALEGASLRDDGGRITARVPIEFGGGYAYHDQSVLWLLHDDGRLMASTMAHIHGGTPFAYGPGSGGQLDAWFAPSENAPWGTAAGLQARTIQLPGGAIADDALLREPPGQVNTCSAPLLFDPPPAVAGVWSWAPFTDLRISVPSLRPELQGGNAHGNTYTLEAYHRTLLSSSWQTVWSATAHDPWSQLTFSTPGPGDYRLHVKSGGLDAPVDCFIPVTITEGVGGAGVLDARITATGDGVEASFQSMLADGTVLDHYEFDTLVVRTDGDGRLVWKGKLHGHAGIAGFSLHNLEPGAYEIHVHPSAQSQDQPDIRRSGGHVHPFTVDAVAMPSDETTPAASPLWLLGLALLRRR